MEGQQEGPGLTWAKQPICLCRATAISHTEHRATSSTALASQG